MGVGPLGNGWHGKNGADGAYKGKDKRDELAMRQSIYHVLNWLRLSGERIGGKSYGSDDIVGRQSNREELYRYVAQRFMELRGKAIPFSVEDIAMEYPRCRKKCYRYLKEGLVITRGSEPMSLFGDHNGEVGATIYAYWGRNQILDRWAIKIGYTGQLLAPYLRKLKRAHSPMLMASRCGGRVEEQAIHASLERFRVEGNEWYYAAETLINMLRREWKLDGQFEYLAEIALRELPFAE